jgi:hypothetical protein
MEFRASFLSFMPRHGTVLMKMNVKENADDLRFLYSEYEDYFLEMKVR